jgi:hypothetical protein
MDLKIFLKRTPEVAHGEIFQTAALKHHVAVLIFLTRCLTRLYGCTVWNPLRSRLPVGGVCLVWRRLIADKPAFYG